MEKLEVESPDSDGEFAFETDHLALRGNKDYCELLKYIVRLETQKAKAVIDIEHLADQQSKALENPLEFVQDLQMGRINFPPRQAVSDPPDIDWSAYGIDVIDEAQITDIKLIKQESDNSTKVRGRMFSDSKPETFNQLWSVEEQKRLEQLLEIYPEEAVEARRYAKIAEALGTRTPLQVNSRIQKYFAKLAKAGMPIPGRMPKKIRPQKTSVLYKRSTFFPQLHVPIKMEDFGENNECIESGLESSNKYMLELLTAAKEQRSLDEVSPIYQTKTIMCVGCQKTGFLGARWTDNSGTDYCTDCVVKILPAEKLIPVRERKLSDSKPEKFNEICSVEETKE